MLLISATSASTQNSISTKVLLDNYKQVKSCFDSAYFLYPSVPRGFLEAVAFTNTRFKHYMPENENISYTGAPPAYGVMGLIKNGKNYFRENLRLISNLSGYDSLLICNNALINILSYAKAYTILQNKINSYKEDIYSQLSIIDQLSELPDSGIVQNFAQDCFLYSVLYFLDNDEYSTIFNFPDYKIDFEDYFGKENYKILSSPKILVLNKKISNEDGQNYNISEKKKNLKSSDYPQAIWDMACTDNFSSRNGAEVTSITLHTAQGTYAGTIAWFNNCSSHVSTHYVIRSFDGQITQMVAESDKAWHVNTENYYTIGYEHEGYIDDPAWYTAEMYLASANLSYDICKSGYNIDPLRCYRGPATAGINVLYCPQIKGHQHFPNNSHTDPGINWDWDYYYKLLNNYRTPVKYNSNSGNFYDSGGLSSNYSDNEGNLWLIEPSGASSVTIHFTDFDIEKDWDYLYVYDGNSVFSTLIGVYTGTSIPATITSTGGSILIEFYSDCSITSSGWAAWWTSVISDTIPPVVNISSNGNWQNSDFDVSFAAQDNPGGSGIESVFFNAMSFTGSEWKCNSTQGFCYDEFNNTSLYGWNQNEGTWYIDNNTLRQSDENISNTNINITLNQNLSDIYIYYFKYQLITTDGNRRLGFHYFADSDNADNRGNSYFIWFRNNSLTMENTLEFYKSSWINGNNIYTLRKTVNDVITQPGIWYDLYIIYNRLSGTTKVIRNNQTLGIWTDSIPLTTGYFISFRTGNAEVVFDNLNVLRNCNVNESITVGSANNNMIQYENINPYQASCKITSLAIDSALNLSQPAILQQNIDLSPPTSVTYVNDGISDDVDTIINNDIHANWGTASDFNSGIRSYWVSVGSFQGAEDIIQWTDNGYNNTVSFIGAPIIQGNKYFVNVKSENNAGLLSPVISSDGQYYNGLTSAINYEHIAYELFTINNGIILKVTSAVIAGITVCDITGKTIITISDKYYSEGSYKFDFSKENILNTGIYTAILTIGENNVTLKFIVIN